MFQTKDINILFGTFLHHKVKYIFAYFFMLYNIWKGSFLCRNPFK